MLRIGYTLILLCISITLCTAQKAVIPGNFKANTHSRSAGNFLYTLTTTNETYTDLVNPISLNNGEVWDELGYLFPLGFHFELLEDVVTGFGFYGSGSVMRSPTGPLDFFAYIYPFETDLIDRGAFDDVSLSPISYVLEGTPGNRIFKLEFKNAGSYLEMEIYSTLDMFINFQMWLYEGSNTIQFRFGPSSIDDPQTFYGADGGAMIGVADFDVQDDFLTNAHFLVGDPSNPFLSSSADGEAITGTPPNNTVYTLSLDIVIDVNLLVSQNNSYCAPEDTIEAEVSDGLPPYSYVWSTGETTPVITVIEDGLYTITITDQLGNTTSSEVIITTPDSMTLNINVTAETGPGANDGTAEVIPTNGASSYSYAWSNGETTSLIENLSPGTYNVTVTDAAGCAETAEAVINLFECGVLLLEASVNQNQCAEVCEGAVTIVDVINGAAPITYAWDNGDSSATINLLCAGIYNVTVTDVNLCVVIASYEITTPTPVVVNASSTNETLTGLNDGTATASPLGGTPPYSYVWSNGDTIQTISNLTPGTYYVLVSDSLNCHSTDSVVIEAGPCAILTATITDATCFGVCDGSIEVLLGGLPPAELTWTGGNGGSLEGESCADMYIISASNGLGCTVVETYTLGQPDELLATIGSTAETINGEDGTAWVTPIGGTPPYTYLWNTGSTDSLITQLMADMYFVTLTDAHGCTDTNSIDVEPFYCFHIIPNEVQNAFCHDSCNGLIFVTILGGVGPFKYAWSTGDTANIIFDLCAGWYSVTVTDLGQGGCNDFIDIEITEPDSFYFEIDELVHVTDSTEGAIHITVLGGTSPYFPVWFGPDKFLSFEDDINGLEPGLYIFNIFDSFDCGLVDTIEILDMTVGIPSIADGLVSIYPNPATDFIYVDTELEGDYDVSIFSSLGTSVGQWKNTAKIDIGHFVPGMYLVAFSNDRGRYIERVVIK